jgi:hypothetical protein
MGFWRDAACFVGLHKWLDWTYRTGSDCTQIQKCSGCGTAHADTRVVHVLADWRYPREGDCRQTRPCTRCSHVEDRTEHAWPSWQYQADGSCAQSRVCTRCGNPASRTSHEAWARWEYRTVGSCKLTRECERCHEVEEDVEHTWGVWAYEGPKTCTQVRFCERCHQREESEPQSHDEHEGWGDWQYKYEANCEVFERRCVRCGRNHTDKRLPRHHWGEWERLSTTQARRLCLRCIKSEWRDIQTQT